LNDGGLLNDIKEKCSYVADDYSAELWAINKDPRALEATYNLQAKSGNQLEEILVGGEARIKPPEILFKPEILTQLGLRVILRNES